MSLHTNLSIKECLARLKQPFLTDPFSKDAESVIKRPATVQVYDPPKTRMWAIIIVPKGHEFEVQKLILKNPSQRPFSLENTKLDVSISCSLTENFSGGTEVEYTKTGPALVWGALTLIFFVFYLLSIAPIRAYLYAYNLDNYEFVYYILIGVIGLFIIEKFRVSMLKKILIKFASELLDAQEVIHNQSQNTI